MEKLITEELPSVLEKAELGLVSRLAFCPAALTLTPSFVQDGSVRH